MTVTCPRCGGEVRPPSLTSSDWRCDGCGPVAPLHVPKHINDQVLGGVVTEIMRDQPALPLWCVWPLPPGWTITGAGWAGDDRLGARATVLAVSGPAPLVAGPADLLLIAEVPGVGLASRFAGLTERDPGPLLAEAMAGGPPHAKVRTERHTTPLWSVPTPPDRSAYIGEAHGIWLVAVAWPASAGYLLADELALDDLCDWLPPELVYGAPSARLGC